LVKTLIVAFPAAAAKDGITAVAMAANGKMAENFMVDVGKVAYERG
jgi:hypothetical protein